MNLRGPIAPRKRQVTESHWFVRLLQALIVVVALLLWQFLPEVQWFRNRGVVFNPILVSSPTKVAHEMWNLATGSAGQPLVWPYLWVTAQGAVLGLVIGLALGVIIGLFVSNSRLARRVARPFIAVLNAIPRIALIPLLDMIGGATMTTTAVAAVLIVFFLVFYNAYAGGISVSEEMIENAQLLGATRWEIMRRIRLPYVMVWTFAALPNAINFSLLAVVTAQILIGQIGMGGLLQNSIDYANSSLTFGIVVILCIIGVIAVTSADFLQRRVLHWWQPS